MGRYLLTRLALSVVVGILLLTMLGALVHIVPGDPARAVLGPRATPELIAEARAEMHLDEPIPEQIGLFLTGAVQGDLGRDFFGREPVTALIARVLPDTVLLAVSGLALAVVLGVPLGVLAATRPNSWLDRLAGILSISLITVPSYVAALLLLLVFAVELDILPAFGAGELSDPSDYLAHLILPVTALAIAWTGYLARLVRASMIEVMNTNYIRTAHAYGLKRTTIVYTHALKNALVPTVAVLGVGLGSLMGNAIFVEVIFSRPGLGSLIYESVATRNFPVLRGAVLVFALLFIVANLLADLCYRLLDPRMRVEGGAT